MSPLAVPLHPIGLFEAPYGASGDFTGDAHGHRQIATSEIMEEEGDRIDRPGRGIYIGQFLM